MRNAEFDKDITSPNGVKRKVDIYFETVGRGPGAIVSHAWEHKSGTYTHRGSGDVQSELDRDAKLVQETYDVQWIFDGDVSQPLLDSLRKANITTVLNH